MNNKNHVGGAVNKTENLKDANLENVSGGYLGGDWGFKDTRTYKNLGINHEKNTWSLDKYYVSGNQEIPKKYAYHIVELYKNRGKYNDYDNQLAEFERLKSGLDSNDVDEFKWATKQLKQIWRDFG